MTGELDQPGYFRRAQERAAEAQRDFDRAYFSVTVPNVTFDAIDWMLELPRVVVSLGTRWCERCAELLPVLEQNAASSGVPHVRHDLDTSNPPGEALKRWADPDPPPPESEFTPYDQQIPVSIYFENGVEVRRRYGAMTLDIADGLTADTGTG